MAQFVTVYSIAIERHVTLRRDLGFMSLPLRLHDKWVSGICGPAGKNGVFFGVWIGKAYLGCTAHDQKGEQGVDINCVPR